MYTTTLVYHNNRNSVQGRSLFIIQSCTMNPEYHSVAENNTRLIPCIWPSKYPHMYTTCSCNPVYPIIAHNNRKSLSVGIRVKSWQAFKVYNPLYRKQTKFTRFLSNSQKLFQNRLFCKLLVVENY